VREGFVSADSFDFPGDGVIITDVYATAYYCVYNNELEGAHTITKTTSNNVYTVNASFLFGGRGVAMQGTGKTAPDGEYINYTGGGGCFVHITGRNAGKNLVGRCAADTPAWVSPTFPASAI
jgi:hypothetical protein